MDLEPVIGLEIHAQLATDSKLFCPCSTEFAAPANANTCPVCMGLPGVLPVVNRQAVEFALRLGMAMHCDIRRDSRFARKNYFYPDLPKAYQISQYDRPICENGWVEIEVDGKTKRIGITRIHLEEDAGKLVHEGEDPKASYVDLNRAGVPLLEIVSEPELSSPDEAKAYMEQVHGLVTYSGVGRGDMEKGNLRADVNISLRSPDQTELGTRTETKNLNSFRFVREALLYEIDRQRDELEAGRAIHQETRLWDPQHRVTYPMRSKEDAHDYRYFPDPDLPCLAIDEVWLERVQKSLPEMPTEKATRFQNELGLSPHDTRVLVADREIAEFFEAVVEAGADPKRAANWVTGNLAARFNEDKSGLAQLKFAAGDLATLIQLIAQGQLSNSLARQVFEIMYDTGREPAEIVATERLSQVPGSELERIVGEVIANNPRQLEQYRAGKTKVMGYFVGQVMKATKGQANPAAVNELLKQRLS